MIEHIIKPTRMDLKEKIKVDNVDKNDAIVLKKWMEQLLNQTEKHILKSKNVEDLLEK
jgi:hypothetical protein